MYVFIYFTMSLFLFYRLSRSIEEKVKKKRPKQKRDQEKKDKQKQEKVDDEEKLQLDEKPDSDQESVTHDPTEL